MGSKATRKIDGFASLGGEVPFVDPDRLVIVGIDEPQDDNNWFAACARLADVTDESLKPYVSDILTLGRVENIVKATRDGDRLLVIDGRRTTRAARLVRKSQASSGIPVEERVTVRVHVVQGKPEDLYRSNLDSHKHQALTRGQYAQSVLTYFQRVGEDLDKTATFFRVSKQTIKTLLAYFNLSAKVQKEMDAAGGLPASLTIKLATMPKSKQDEVLEEMRASGALRGGAAVRAVEAASKGRKVDGAVKARALPKPILERWRDALEADTDFETVEILDFILGRAPLSESALAKFAGSLERAGWKQKTPATPASEAA